MSIIQRAVFIYQLCAIFVLYFPAVFLLMGVSYIIAGKTPAKQVWEENNIHKEINWKAIKEEWRYRGKIN